MKLRTNQNGILFYPNVNFVSGVKYSFSVSAENSIASGNNSEHSHLTFDEENPFASYDDIKVDSSSFNYTLTNLAPAESYEVQVLPVKNAMYGSPKNTIQITWKLHGIHKNFKWKYALYYGSSENELLKGGIRLTTEKTWLRVVDLNACENYIFRVNIIEPVGVGRVSPFKTFTTPYSLLSPPKNLKWTRRQKDINSVILTWSPPCSDNAREKNMGYFLTIYNFVTRKNRTIHLERINYINNEYTMRDLHYGGYYQVQVRTDIQHSAYTSSLLIKGPEIPAPVEFTRRTEKKYGSLDPGVVYYLCVELITSQGYKSGKSALITIERPSVTAIVVFGNWSRRHHGPHLSFYHPIYEEDEEEENDSPIIRGKSNFLKRHTTLLLHDSLPEISVCSTYYWLAKIYNMKWWCLILGLAFLQVAVFFENVEASKDTDGDGIPDSEDEDDDNDGIPDIEDNDDDGDGILDEDDDDHHDEI
ncbi:TTN [Lepeophtheirus salmonis]|uniref:TTN n=1 Tax=Lepeophtheirus salmonis TaxID=72036 RepID=A0A7R8CPU8_LEPSM|nr:TTN [Lepeophtheirus salmonis]CAF2889613.1 TTN [Lepeophtheirus salmonis]